MTAATVTCPSWCDNHTTTDVGQEVCARTRKGRATGGEWFVEASHDNDGLALLDVWLNPHNAGLNPAQSRDMAAALLEVATAVEAAE